MPEFYTYMWLRADGTPYYVGKGHSVRAFVHHGANHRPVDTARILIQNWESEGKAFEMEKWFIALFGRKDLGTGILHNLSDGGDGPAGWRATAAARQTQSIRMKSGLRTFHLITPGERAKGGRKSAATVLKQVGRSVKIRAWREALHVRWHVKRNLIAEGCDSCVSLK